MPSDPTCYIAVISYRITRDLAADGQSLSRLHRPLVWFDKTNIVVSMCLPHMCLHIPSLSFYWIWENNRDRQFEIKNKSAGSTCLLTDEKSNPLVVLHASLTQPVSQLLFGWEWKSRRPKRSFSSCVGKQTYLLEMTHYRETYCIFDFEKFNNNVYVLVPAGKLLLCS